MNILILGASVMQIPALEKAKKLGHFVLCADGNDKAIGRDKCDIFYPVDIKDKESLLEIANKFHLKHTLHGVFTVGTDFSSSVAWITEKLNLPGISYQAALNATDKIRMRQCFKENNVSSPGYVEYSTEQNLKETITDLDYPLVVKPVDSMGARGVKRVDSFKELELAITDSIHHSRSSRAIIEEFIDGPEFSLDALIIDGKVEVFGFADRNINFPPYFVEMGHTIPTNIDKADKDSIIDLFSKGVKALGLTYGSAKGDMKMSKKGPVIGEIAARLSGGFMSGWTYPYSSGVDLIKGGIELALGQKLTILDKLNINKTSAERSFISIPGIVKEIETPKKQPKGVMDIYCSVAISDKVVFPKNNVEKCGNVISLAETRVDAIKYAEKCAAEILIRLEPNIWETQEFLFNNTLNHKAFDIDSKLFNSLDESVESDNKTIFVKKIDKILKSRKKDWQNRTISQVLKKINDYYNIEFVDDTECGLEFYTALINGSIQGVLYYLDTLEI